MLDSYLANPCICSKGLSGIRTQTLRNKSRSFLLLQTIALYSHVGNWELWVIGLHLKTMNPKSTKQINLTDFVSQSSKKLPWLYKKNLSNWVCRVVQF